MYTMCLPVLFCVVAIELEPKYAKARARRAKAFEEVGDVMNCLKGLSIICISHKLASSRYANC